MSDLLSSRSLNLFLQPYLQETYSKKMILKGVENYKAKASQGLTPSSIPLKGRLTLAVFIGIGETVAYVAMRVISQIILLISVKAHPKAQHYAFISKGAASATLVAILSIWSTTFALQIEKKIEDAADEEARIIVKDSRKKLDNKIRKEYDAQAHKGLNTDVQSYDATFWNIQSEDLREEMQKAVNDFKAHYSQLHANEKYASLQMGRKDIQKVELRVSDLVLSKKDKRFGARADKYAQKLLKNSVTNLVNYTNTLIKAKKSAIQKQKEAKALIEEAETTYHRKYRILRMQKGEKKDLETFYEFTSADYAAKKKAITDLLS